MRRLVQHRPNARTATPGIGPAEADPPLLFSNDTARDVRDAYHGSSKKGYTVGRRQHSVLVWPAE